MPLQGTARSAQGATMSAAVDLFLPCAAGVEAFLADEVQAIAGGTCGLPDAVASRCAATPQLAMRLNLESRLAQRVLWRVAEARYRNEDELYALARGVRWVDWITPKQTLRVDTTARSAPVKSLNFASLRIKDAVCDSVREAVGARPDVDTRDPDLSLVLHLDGDLATLYVDTSGVPLFKRGWRDAQAGDAPLKETLAAALLVAAGWRGRAEDGPLLDPCCGSGTIAIEAAHIACGRAPGLARRFAFEKLLPFRDHMATWRDMVSAAKARVHAEPRADLRRRRVVSHDRLRAAPRRARRRRVGDPVQGRRHAAAPAAGTRRHDGAEPAVWRAFGAQGARGCAACRRASRCRAHPTCAASMPRWPRTGSATTPAGRPGC